VKFRVGDDRGKSALLSLDKTYFVIWTPPSGRWGQSCDLREPGFTYALVEAGNGEAYIFAEELARAALEKAGLGEGRISRDSGRGA
jgi:isoleucyl-tRNA synthetase